MQYFTIPELTRSFTAEELKIPNVPSEDAICNLTRLIEKVLDPIREKWGRPIIVNSGYRSKQLNDYIKGSKTSHHLTGCAADIKAKAKSPKELKELNRQLFDLIASSNIPFTQLIDENNYSWVHISYDPCNIVQHRILHLK